MKLFFTTNNNETTIHFGLLLLRVISGLPMAFYGYEKLIHFSTQFSTDFWEKDINFLGYGGAVSLGLTIFAEFFCSLFLILGFMTRLSLVPLLFCMGYIVAIVDKYHIITAGEHGYEINHAFFYFVLYFILLLNGPGKWSLDKMISKK